MTTSHSEDDTMWFCEKCNKFMYVEQSERHQREWHKDDLSAESGGTPQAPELDGPA